MKLTFKQFLTEGGNVSVTDIHGAEHLADRMDLRKIPRETLANIISALAHKLNSMFKKEHGSPIWTSKELIDTGHAFNGSSELLFDKSIPTDKFIKHKPTLGDIDLTMPEDLKHEFRTFIDSIKSEVLIKSNIDGHKVVVTYLGNNKESRQIAGEQQINSLFQVEIDNTPFNIQIDFEMLPYKDGKPTAFTKFTHSSDWEDIKAGLKGVAHKYLIRSLVSSGSLRDDVVVVQKAAREGKEVKYMSSYEGRKHVNMMKFSVGRGVRKAFYQSNTKGGNYETEGGTPWKIDGKFAFKEIPTSESTYEEDPIEMLSYIFPKEVVQKHLSKINSFVGILDLMKKYSSEETIQQTFDRMIDLFFEVSYTKDGRASPVQGFERNNPEGDKEIKMAAINKMVEVLPQLKKKMKTVNQEIEKYYANYKMAD